ncbi:adenosine deaminase 2 [Scaptodrosophila lebanonensis]|uniref:Adenosine deaminase n=1 Tax=Drosophila lebanonensis TaxID=7225 RepID=A0A6J2UHU3_DROLE|nr:adenosine deaminase 2 [Scaptodrosophila lebanonensis]
MCQLMRRPLCRSLPKCICQFFCKYSETKCSDPGLIQSDITWTPSMDYHLRKSSPEAYKKLRKIAKTFSRSTAVGSFIELTAQEHKANQIIMKAKKAEYSTGILDPEKFAPGYHIFQALPKINESALFKILAKMPKGGALTTHDTSMCSTEYLIQLTYRENLWVCTRKEGCKVVAFRFSKEKPTIKAYRECNWEPMEALRERRGDENVRKYLNRRFSMYPLGSFSSNNEAWRHFMHIFDLVDGLVQYAPIWGEYFYNAMKEFLADNVQYMEVRTLLPQLYCLDGTLLPVSETVQIYKDQINKFVKDHPNFIGAKLIYAPLRNVDRAGVAKYVKTCSELNEQFPDVLVGFDLVGQEDVGLPLVDFVEELVKMPTRVKFYFHAGQTNWSGSEVDANLVDAVLLGTKRIGHGYAVTKHPLIMALAKYLDICIEVCPISNQVLQLGQDIRSHPASLLYARNVPIIISSGSPSYWHAAPLSHDMYMAFLGIAPINADLKFLKRVAKNSIAYSTLSDEEKSIAFLKWKEMWNKWIDDIVKNEGSEHKESVK